VMLRTTSHAARFESFRNMDEFLNMVAKLPPYKQPGILPDQIAGVPARLPKLAT